MPEEGKMRLRDDTGETQISIMECRRCVADFYQLDGRSSTVKIFSIASEKPLITKSIDNQRLSLEILRGPEFDPRGGAASRNSASGNE
jgi:hypothetical protein